MVPDVLKGVMIGLGVAMPVGPCCLLCLNYAMTRGFRIAIAAAIGTSIADALFALCAILGVEWMGAWLVEHGVLFCLVSALFLVYLGIVALRAEPPKEMKPADQTGGKLRAAMILFLMTLANPMTIITYATLIGSMGVGFMMGSSGVTGWVVLGVFLGSIGWWALVTGFVSRFRHKLTPAWIGRLRRLGGSALLVFAALSLMRAFFS